MAGAKKEAWYDVRWQCDCGRFISESAITTTDHRDPSAWYGISTTWEYDCSRCGHVEGYPRCIEVREILVEALDG